VKRPRYPYAEALGLLPKSPGKPLQVKPPPSRELLFDLAAVSRAYPMLRPRTKGGSGGFVTHLQKMFPQYRDVPLRKLQREVRWALIAMLAMARGPRVRQQAGIPLDMSKEDAALELLRYIAASSRNNDT
jgi:hypothetical protein